MVDGSDPVRSRAVTAAIRPGLKALLSLVQTRPPLLFSFSPSIYSSFFLQTHGVFGGGLIFQTTHYPIQQISLRFTQTPFFFYLFRASPDSSLLRLFFYYSAQLSSAQLTHGNTPCLSLFFIFFLQLGTSLILILMRVLS